MSKRQPIMLDWLVFVGFVVLAALVFSTGSSSAVKRRMTCDEEIEDVRTQLRLRTAELAVARGQLGSMRKKLEACRGSTEE